MPAEDMARDAGASRTFRSIFGADGEQPASAADTKQEADQVQDQGQDQTRVADVAMGEEEDGDAMWSDADNNEDAERLSGADGRLASAADVGKSIADWADDEEDEEVWKDALQARVNQLDLVLPPGAGPREQEDAWRMSGGAREGRLKMQRTARGRASNSSNSSGGGGADQGGVRKKRPGSTDFIARNIQAVELKRSVSGGSSRGDSPAAAGVKTARLRRKGSLDLTVASPASSNGTRAARTRGPVFDLSETEAIRRFVVDDIKQMSMERLVGNAKRLHFLEEFFQHHAPAMAATSSTAAAAPLSPISSRPDV